MLIVLKFGMEKIAQIIKLNTNATYFKFYFVIAC